MRNLKSIFPRGSFDAVVNLSNAWGYFDRRSDDRKTLAGISHILKPGGALVINTLNEGGVIHRLRGDTRRWREEKRSRYLLQDFAYERAAKRLNARWTRQQFPESLRSDLREEYPSANSRTRRRGSRQTTTRRRRMLSAIAGALIQSFYIWSRPVSRYSSRSHSCASAVRLNSNSSWFSVSATCSIRPTSRPVSSRANSTTSVR